MTLAFSSAPVLMPHNTHTAGTSINAKRPQHQLPSLSHHPSPTSPPRLSNHPRPSCSTQTLDRCRPPEVEVSLPPKIETRIAVPLSAQQTFWYRR
jgi:hypothetical protein